LLSGVGIGALGAVAGLNLVFGAEMVLVVASAVVGGLAVLGLVLAAVRRRPRVIISADRFVSQALFGEESHRWEDIAGPFAVIRSGWSKLVAFNFTPAYKARVSFKPTTLYSGYDSAIAGAFRLSKEELAGLLNEYRQAWLRSAPASGADEGRPS
jgi:hypothetical protein